MVVLPVRLDNVGYGTKMESDLTFLLTLSTCQYNFPSKFQKLLTEAYVVAFLSTLLLPILRKLTDDNIEGLSKTN